MSANLNTRNVTVKGLELKVDMIVQGIATLPATATLSLDGKSLTQPDALKAAQAVQAGFKTRRELRNQLAEKQHEFETTGRAGAVQFVNASRHMAAAFLGESSGELLKFGFKPKGKRPPLTLEQKAAKAEKARRTREARHTLGPRQKAAIHGSPEPTTGATQPATPVAPGPDSTRKAV